MAVTDVDVELEVRHRGCGRRMGTEVRSDIPLGELDDLIPTPAEFAAQIEEYLANLHWLVDAYPKLYALGNFRACNVVVSVLDDGLWGTERMADALAHRRIQYKCNCGAAPRVNRVRLAALIAEAQTAGEHVVWLEG